MKLYDEKGNLIVENGKVTKMGLKACVNDNKIFEELTAFITCSSCPYFEECGKHLDLGVCEDVLKWCVENDKELN